VFSAMWRAFFDKTGKLGLAFLVLATTLGSPSLVHARSGGSENRVAISVSELPPQGRDTYQLILRGGPFPFDKDGTVFGNRERLLPANRRGYYREYTVRTPGSRDRGARRIVCGGQPRTPEACYYTADHYASFRKIVD